jgi:hypothetical protein
MISPTSPSLRSPAALPRWSTPVGLCRGTSGSNPFPSGRQSANLRFLSGGAKSAGRRGGNYGIDYIGPDCAALGLLGIYLYDPNGIPLEFACQPEDGEAHRRCSPASLRRKRKRVANWRPYRRHS